jgi:ubiquinone/menaquinone biosynthesis C-methylase UbiE
MQRTTERHDPDSVRTIEDSVVDAMHRYAYRLAASLASPSDRVLDVGFGEGYGSVIVAPRVLEYVGVDVEHDAATHATEKYGSPAVRFAIYDGKSLPFQDSSFDLVISFQVIEHVPGVSAFLSELHRVTRPGSATLFTTPNRNHRLAEGERPWNRYHVREFSPAELEAVVRGVFPSVEIFGVSGSPTMVQIERRRIARARKLARIDRLGLRYMLPERLDNALRGALRRRGSVGAELGEEELAAVGVEHVRHSKDAVDSAIDLLAIARR